MKTQSPTSRPLNLPAERVIAARDGLITQYRVPVQLRGLNLQHPPDCSILKIEVGADITARGGTMSKLARQAAERCVPYVSHLSIADIEAEIEDTLTLYMQAVESALSAAEELDAHIMSTYTDDYVPELVAEYRAARERLRKITDGE